MTIRASVLADHLGVFAQSSDPPDAGDGADADAGRVDALRALEGLKSAACAAQARVSAAFAASQRAEQERAGVPASRAGRGIASQIGLARRESPNRATHLLGLATSLATEMPHTLAALARGEINEWRATLIVRETAVLSREHRAAVDRELCGPGGGAASLGDAGIERAARRIGQRLDPGAAWARAQKAAEERRVTIRPAPGCMARVTAILPAAEGVGVYAALSQAADTAAAQGPAARGPAARGSAARGSQPVRGRGQLMADELVRRVLGSPVSGTAGVELQLVMTDLTLLGLSDEPAQLAGYGPLPAPMARLIALGGDVGAGRAVRWVRRLYRRPGGTGELIAMDSRRRLFPGGIRRFVVARDQFCRTPWCDALIRHIDHVVRAEDGGPTSAANSQGLCVACNYAKEALGWRQTVDEVTGSVVTSTPAGPEYTSDPPPLVGAGSSAGEGGRDGTSTAA